MNAKYFDAICILGFVILDELHDREKEIEALKDKLEYLEALIDNR